MLRIALCIALLFVPAAALPACGGGGGGDGGPTVVTRDYVGTQAPGDLWSWSIGPGTAWRATNDTLGYFYEGTWSALAAGFLKLTVDDNDDPDTTNGDVAYALEVPDTVLVVKPAGADDNVIIAARIGSCPASGTYSFNYVEMTESTWSPIVDEAYGVANVNVSGVNWTGVTATYLLDGTPLGTDPIPAFTCSGGIATNTLAPDEVLVVAPTGVFISDRGPGEGGVMGMSHPAAPIDLPELVAAGREYRAIQYTDELVGAPDCRLNWARPDGLGGMLGGDYLDVEANTENAASAATLTFDTQPLPGVVNGTLTDGAGTSDILFMINQIAGRYFLFGVSVNTATAQPYNFIAIELP